MALRSRKAQDMGLTEARIDAGCYEYESDASFTEAEKWAPRYADQMFLDATKIDAAFYNELKKHYSEPQIMELGAFIAFHYGMQMFYAVNWSGSAKESRIGEYAMALLPVSAFGT
ncbi:MAG: hypothetical protein WA729_14115 [Pseudolabrys sp.]